MAWASSYTLTPLDNFANFFGFNPLGFNTLTSESCGNVFPSSCNQLWFQETWQTTQVSREELADVIKQAENDIKAVIKMSIAPDFEENEEHFPFKQYNKVTGNAFYQPSGKVKSFFAKYLKFIKGGRRNTFLIDTVEVVYSSPDLDGFNEKAEVTIDLTSFIDTIKEETNEDVFSDLARIKLYFAGYDARREMEIRPIIRKKTDNVIVFTGYSWLFVNPLLQTEFPNDLGAPHAIDGCDSSVFVENVEVVFEYVDDFTNPPAILGWERPPCGCFTIGGCSQCAIELRELLPNSHVYQPATILNRIKDSSCLVVSPIYFYDENHPKYPPPEPEENTPEHDEWERLYPCPDYLVRWRNDPYWQGTFVTKWNTPLNCPFKYCRPPDFVNVWYYAGCDTSQKSQIDGLRGCKDLERVVFWLTAARLSKPFCACQECDASTKLKEFQREFAIITDASKMNLDMHTLSNPFGTRNGEIMAWRYLVKLMGMSLHRGGVL